MKNENLKKSPLDTLILADQTLNQLKQDMDSHFLEPESSEIDGDTNKGMSDFLKSCFW